MKHGTTIFAVAILILYASLHSADAAPKPDWVRERPVSATHYTGIGVASSSGANRDYLQAAKENALEDLASQIKIVISSEVMRTLAETSGTLIDDYEKVLRSHTKAELEGYELVGTWEDSSEYWVYYRLSRSDHESRRRAKIERAVSLSKDLVGRARESESDREYDRALHSYLQSFHPVEKYLNEPLETSLEGKKVYLQNEIFTSIQSLLGMIEIGAVEENREATVGRPLDRPLQVTADHLGEDGVKTGISNLPLRFSFLRGSGELVEKVRTGRRGNGSCRISKVSSTDRIQIVKARLDIDEYVDRNAVSLILGSIIEGFSIPEAKFVLNVSGLSGFIASEEIHFDRRLNVLHIEPAIKNFLSGNGFIFVKNADEADLLFAVKAESRKGSDIYGMYSAFVDLTVSATDMTTGREVYKSSLHDVKGIDLEYEKAGLKAFENAAERVREDLMPGLIDRIHQ